MSDIKMTRKELYDLVWSTPMTKLAKQYSISDNGLRKICKKMDIPLPKAGHWEKLKAGKKVIVEKLSTNYSGKNEIDLTAKSKENALKFAVPSEMRLLQKEIEEALGSELEVPEKLTNPCELIKDAKHNMETSKSSRDLHNGLIDFRRGFSFYVQPVNLGRALRFMDTLIKTMLIRGHPVSYDYDRNQLVFKINDEDFQIAFREKTKRIEVETKYGWNRTIKEPTGVFLLQATGWLRGESIWQDGKLPIEKQISKILTSLEIKSLKIAEERREWKKRQAIRDEEIRKEREQVALVANELNKVKELINAAERWRIAKDIREYIQGGMSNNKVHSSKEIEWANKKADWIDPTIAHEDEFLTEKDKRLIITP